MIERKKYLDKLISKNYKLLLVKLKDYACPSFCTGTTAYIGTLDSIIEFAAAGMKSNREVPYFCKLNEAADKYRQGHHDVTLDIGFGEQQFAIELTTFAEAEYTDREQYIKFFNIHKCENLLFTEQISASVIYVRNADSYMRCVKASMKNLSIVDDKGGLVPIEDFWGHPEVLYHDGDFIRSRLYTMKKRFNSEAECRADLENPSPISFDSFLYDVFGDG